MSSRGRARLAPGGREYEKKKALNKRRGAPRTFESRPKEDDEERKRRDDSEDESEGEENESKSGSEEEGDDSREESGSGDEEGEGGDWKHKSNRAAKPKGLQGVIDVENPNREQKTHMKANEVLNLVNRQQNAAPTRKEKEAMEKQRIQNRIEKQDLARLQQVRKEREEAAKRREEEKNAKSSKVKEGIKKLTI
eukprot:TRINITY_DN9777_c0_g1_i3.p1 TRINITY_DN9777_c0_g1~~TRINITY_DN9777_c0_g1_i3.p1  ORF type:complete len:194 (-),score=76.32 TRINITY_DN9777_c0_g1_i3:25-606(-)